MASPNGPLPARPPVHQPHRVPARVSWAARLECDVSTSNHPPAPRAIRMYMSNFACTQLASAQPCSTVLYTVQVCLLGRAYGFTFCSTQPFLLIAKKKKQLGASHSSLKGRPRAVGTLDNFQIV